eukprot:gene27916-33713_t
MVTSAIEVYDKIAAETYCLDLNSDLHDRLAEAAASVFYNLSQAVVRTTRVLDCELSESNRFLLLEKSSVFLQEAIKHNPALAEAYLNLSGLYIKLKRPTLAIDVIKDALQRSSHCFKELLVNLNVAHRQLNQRPLAINDSWSYLSIPLEPMRPCQQLLKSFRSRLVSYAESRQCTSADRTLTIVCVKYGTKYGPEYVVRLFRMIDRTWYAHVYSPTSPSSSSSREDAYWQTFRFVCLTDDPAGLQAIEQAGARILPLSVPHTEHFDKAGGWWCKASIFNTSSYVSADSSSSVLYVDLDTVIQSFSMRALRQVFASLPYATPHSPQCYMYFLDAAHLPTEGRHRGINSSLLLFPPTLFDFVFSFFEQWGAALLRGVHKFDHFLEMMLGEMLYDPAIVAEESLPHLAFSLHDCEPLRPRLLDLQAYEMVRRADHEEQKGVLVCFPLHPKPHQLPADHPLRAVWAESDRTDEAR